MLTAVLVGIFTIADELVDVAQRSRGAEEMAVAQSSNLPVFRRSSALKHADDFDNAKATFRNADDLAIANRLDNLDDFTGGRRTADEAAQVRDRLARNSNQGALSRRIESNRAARQVDETPLSGSGGACKFNSFTEGTPVHTAEGQKPIEEIEVGDKVLAEDPDTGEQGYFEVVALTSHAEDDILHITIEAEAKDKAEKTATLDSGEDNGNNDRQQLNSETMEITPDHPVYIEGQGWLWAKNLSPTSPTPE